MTCRNHSKGKKTDLGKGKTVLYGDRPKRQNRDLKIDHYSIAQKDHFPIQN
jgi:hypothetical protein